jgi:hypothetical protein
MIAAIAIAVVAVMAALAFVHIYWAMGGRIGKSAAIPEINRQSAFVPSKTATLLVAAALMFAATVVAVAGGLVAKRGFGGLFRMLAFGLSATFVARAVGDFRLVGFFKRNRGTRFSRLDTLVFSPLCMALGLAVLYIAVHDV